MRGKAGNSERARFEFGGKLRVERFGDRWFDLVLDGDVQARAGLILGDEQAAKFVRQFVADREQFGAVNAVGDAPAQQHNLAEPRHW